MVAESRQAWVADPVIRRLEHFDGARDSAYPLDRLAEVRRRARTFREEMLDGDPVPFYRAFGLVRVPYPTRYGLLNAYAGVQPFMHILNRMIVVRFRSEAGLKTLLVSPSDIHANKRTPFFDRMSGMMGPLRQRGERFLAPQLGTVPERIVEAGLRLDQIDYITYDHLHTQDIRRWLGTEGRPGLLPRAKLLVMRQEWCSASKPVPHASDWYCPEGLDGVDPSKVVLLDGDVMLGDGVALIHTPGHTEGNHSIVVRTPDGLLVTSENGVGPDAYAPQHSRIPGVRKYARAAGMEVILNGNTLEGSVDQYISMVQEKEMAGPSPRNPEFFNVYSSSELTAYWGFPGIKPTWNMGDLAYGAPDAR